MMRKMLSADSYKIHIVIRSRILKGLSIFFYYISSADKSVFSLWTVQMKQKGKKGEKHKIYIRLSVFDSVIR